MKKDELQNLALLCKSEVDSLGRIAAGVLRILKLEGSVGSAAISQLSNLGNSSSRCYTMICNFRDIYFCVQIPVASS